jgi:tetratricopeptide (TPR) repeat protein
VFAIKKYEEIEELEPEDPLPIAVAKATALIEVGQLDEAQVLVDDWLEREPEHNPLRIVKSHLLCEQGNYGESEALLRELIVTYPGNANLLTNLGQTLLWIGKLDEAAECFERAAEVNPMALAQVLKTRRLPSDPGAVGKMEKIADNRFLARGPRATMSFALAELHDKNKAYDKASEYLSLGNSLMDAEANYDPDTFTRRVDALIDVFSEDYFDRLEPIRRGDRTPVFVVGMPRSGTTLTEQILCSHPDVFGAGELELMTVLSRIMPQVLKTRQAFPRCMNNMTAALREEAARYYLYGIKQHDATSPFVVDKMPHNFTNLGLIAATLPGAKIIHVYRDPRDNALSNFQQNFKARDGGMGYAFDLVKIARQINDYHRVMQHWRQVLPMPIFELCYEQLVEDQEGLTRELLQFIGVDWSDSVTEFHKTERAVRTASVSQVRQPIYKSSKQKWRNYEELLQPLIDALDEEVLRPWN